MTWPVIELYHHTVHAGLNDEAWVLYRDRLWRTIYYQLGAYQTQIELLRAFFPTEEDVLPRLTDEAHQAHAMNELANSYSLSGQPRCAVPLFETMNASFEKRGDKSNLAIGLGNVADDQLKIGALRAAEANLRRRIALCREIEDESNEAIGRQELGRLLAYRGVWAEAEEELLAAQQVFDELGPGRTNYGSVNWAYRALRALLLARTQPQYPMPNTQSPLSAARRALQLADETARTRYPHE